MEKIDIEKSFSTTDLLLATILRTKDFQLKGWQKVGLNVGVVGFQKVMFYFERSPELEKEVQDFFKTDCYPYKKFYREFQQLKNIIYQTTVDNS